jgi:hypothetical protein
MESVLVADGLLGDAFVCCCHHAQQLSDHEAVLLVSICHRRGGIRIVVLLPLPLRHRGLQIALALHCGDEALETVTNSTVTSQLVVAGLRQCAQPTVCLKQVACDATLADAAHQLARFTCRRRRLGPLMVGCQPTVSFWCELISSHERGRKQWQYPADVPELS